jgi:hypothetical protein
MVWEAVFLLVVLKIPIAYLCLVIWWAVRAEPLPEQGAPLVARVSPTDGGTCDWHRTRTRRLGRDRAPRRPAGGHARRAYARAGATR